MIVYFTFHDRIISVTLSNMTSAAPLSVVLTLFSKGKEGKRGRSEGHVWKGYKDYLTTLSARVRFGLRIRKYMCGWVLRSSFFFNFRKLCTLEIVPLILQVFWVDFQLKERIISPINREVFVYDCMLTVKIVHYQDQMLQLDRIIHQLLDLVKKQ